MRPGVPRMHGHILNFVHVKDVAQAHINALEVGENLHRYPLCAGAMSMRKVVGIIKKEFGGKHVKSTSGYGKWRMWFMSLFSKNYERIYQRWEVKSELDGDYAMKELSLKRYTSIPESIKETCEFLVKNGLVEKAFVLPTLK